jgi:hypothetical protein
MLRSVPVCRNMAIIVEVGEVHVRVMSDPARRSSP